jgi:hypothetical protein
MNQYDLLVKIICPCRDVYGRLLSVRLSVGHVLRTMPFVVSSQIHGRLPELTERKRQKMPGELMPRRRVALVQREAQAAVAELAARTQVEQASVRATSAVAEYAMSEVTYLTRMKNELAMACPDASEALALIANTASMAIARSVHRFGSEVC